MPYYEMKSGTGHKEGDKLVPDGARGRWWHETLRGLGMLDLNVVVVRIGAEYGRGTIGGQVIPRLVVGESTLTQPTYSRSHIQVSVRLQGDWADSSNEDMEFLYKYVCSRKELIVSSDLRIHTIHTSDVARGIFLAGKWAAQQGQAQARALAGEEIHWGFEKSDTWRTVNVVPESRTVILPLFNIVDDNDSTQDKLAKAVADVWRIKYGFHNSAIATLIARFAKVSWLCQM